MLLRAKIDVVAQQIARLDKTVLHHQEKLRESEDALSTKQSEHAQLQGEFRDLTDKGFTGRPIAGTAKKRRSLGSADALNEVVERERLRNSPQRRHDTSKFCLLSRLRSPRV